MSKNFVKKFWVKNFLGHKNFGSKNILGKKFLGWKIFGQKDLDPKFFFCLKKQIWEINISENSGPLTSLPVNCLNVDQLQRWRSCHRSSSPGVSAKLRVCRIHLLKLLRGNALLKTEWNFFDFSIWILIFRKNRSLSYYWY